MKLITIIGLIISLQCAGSIGVACGKGINNKLHKYSITLPDQFVEIDDSSNSVFSKAYIDSARGVILLLSAQKSRFKTVTDYIDCSRQELEQQLRTEYGDTSLQLLSCSKPEYYPKKTTELHFEVTQQLSGFNTYLIYFIHHHHRDIQISFMYKKENERGIAIYIKGIMQTLKLK